MRLNCSIAAGHLHLRDLRAPTPHPGLLGDRLNPKLPSLLLRPLWLLSGKLGGLSTPLLEGATPPTHS